MMLELCLLALSAAPAPQDPPPPPDLPALDDPAPLLASDGLEATPGRVPADASEEAVRRWRRVLASVVRGEDASRPRLEAFDLALEVTARRVGGSNDTKAGFRYLEDPRGPFLRTYLERKDLVLLRGPAGDFLIDGEEARPLEGRDAAEDLRRLEQFASICRNFVALTRPDQVRLVRIEAREAPAAPPGEGAALEVRFGPQRGDAVRLPDAEHADLARSLEWLYVESPDFELYAGASKSGAERVPRALLGLDRESGEVRLAVLAAAGGGSLVQRDSLLVRVREYRDLEGGWRVPRALEVRQVDPNRRPWTFARLEVTELWLTGDSRINPELVPRDFLPR